jgi:hypothetical protein
MAMREGAAWMREATGDAIRASRNAARRGETIRGFVVATVAVPVMTVLAPLGTERLELGPRFLFWLILMEAGALIGLGATRLVERWGRFPPKGLLEGAAVSLLIAAPLTVVVALCRTFFFGMRLPRPSGALIMFGFVLVVCVVMVAITFALDRRPTAPADETVVPTDAFAERLPLPLRGLAILALEAEDHYLRVHLEGGQSTLILMRLTDAIAALAAVPGARTHRSWWVAKAAVTRVAKADGRATLTLAGGIEAPVSRSYYKTLGEAGWLV